ncbi:hypothetical protein JOD20_003244 [Herpetosiphon giganteus]|nr:hypothetical protein [Herpetosiphon giganteus]
MDVWFLGLIGIFVLLTWAIVRLCAALGSKQ